MDIIVTSSEDQIESLADLTFFERLSIALKRVKYKGTEGMSQKDLAEYVGVSTSMVSKIMSGDAPPNESVREKMNAIHDSVYV